MTKDNSDVPARQKACTSCGNAHFTWGNLSVGKANDENRNKVFFREFGMTYEDGDLPIAVRRCNSCGRAIFFINDA